MSAQLAGTAPRYRWAVMGIAALVLLLAGFLIGSARAEVTVGGSTWRQVVWVSCLR